MSTELGHTQFARTPRRPYSTAIDFVSITTPAFDAQYAALYGTARTPATDATFTMQPRDSTSAGSDRLTHEERAGEVHRQRPVPVVEGHVGRGREPADAGHVHEHVEPAPGCAPRPRRRRHTRPDRSRHTGRRSRRHRRPRSRRRWLPPRPPSRSTQITRAPSAANSPARGGADAAAGAGHEHGASCESSGHGGVVSHGAVRRGAPQRRGGRRVGFRLVPRRRRDRRRPHRADRPDPRARRREIDAEGHVVTPGFIDGHTHMDAQVFWDTRGANSCWHGVTTVVMGNCGFTLAPVRNDARELVVRNLERAEDIDPRALADGIEWSWETFAEYLDAVDRLPKSIHYAANVGHSALRTFVMGERAFTDAATDDDLAAMERELAAALAAGAIGFTTSRSEHHETSDDRPVASRLATWDELVRLVHVMADAGVGMLEGGAEGVLAPDPEVRAQVVERVLDLAATTRRADDERHHRHRSGRPRDARAPRPRRRRRWADDRPVALPRHQRAAVVQDPPAVRPAARVAAAARAAARGAAARAVGSRGARAAGRGGDGRRLHAVARDRRDAAHARLRRHPRLRARPPSEPDRRRRRASPRREPGDGHDRPRPRIRLRGAVHPAEPVPAGRGGPARGAAPPADGHDVLRLRRAPQPDLRLVDPDPPARVLGPGARGVHARGGRADAHVRARDRVGVRRPRPAARRDAGRRERLRSRRRSAPPCPRS